VLRVTAELGVAAVIGTVVIGAAVALALNEKMKGRAIYRTIWYLPAVISGAVMAQTLIAAPPSADGPADQRTVAARASRSAAVRPLGLLSSPVDPAPSGHGGIGVLLAALSGFAVWRFRARPNRRSISALFR